YNSGLFHLRAEKGREGADSLTPRLSIDDKTFKDILGNLYYPDSPYDFNVMPADILGQVYEQFLGKVIRLTKGGRAEVEDKPEVKKAGGVFYTPTYIVDYIVKQTVGKLVEEKTPDEVAKLKICDPACGSGSFLLGAYQFLLDWHLNWYGTHQPERWAKGKDPKINLTPRPPLLPGEGEKAQGGGERTGEGWKLTTAEKRRILLNNLYGVDIDPQAVEVTKLSLLLKVLEGENEGSLRQLSMFHERVLPDLDANIKCGNSLIGPDFYDGQQLGMFDLEERYRVNAFDWEAEFLGVFYKEGKKGGFDVVIGNPPYVRQELISEHKDYFEKHFKVYHGTADLYTYFIEKGVNLLNEGGYFSYIVANKWMRAKYGFPLRQWMKERYIDEIIDFGDLPVFHKATTYPCILRIANKPAVSDFQVSLVDTLDFTDLNDYVQEHNYLVNKLSLDDNGWSLSNDKIKSLVKKIYSMSIPLKNYVGGRIHFGIKTGFNDAFIIDEETRRNLILEDEKSSEIIKPLLMGRDVKKYFSTESGRYLIFTRRGIKINEYPAIKKYLSQYKERLMPKPKGWNGLQWSGRKSGAYEWYEIQDTVEYYKAFEEPKIIVPTIANKAIYSFDIKGIYSNDKTSIIASSDLYLLGLLNSKVPDFIMHLIASTKQGGYFEYKPMYLAQLPIRPINFSDPAEVALHNRMVALVQSMLDLHKQLSAAHTPTEKTMLQRQIATTDKAIDQLVYQLYGLTEEEIAVVEGA
ncbi:MAG TPA: TaqI-like C-terminal specificity domain-containing protein, partial [Anaerolineales bacterium]|nr:TaqI-like C-terminal specificity domain-containing protein [Anaerolineales bacterium]